jgi:hypothetical protein
MRCLVAVDMSQARMRDLQAEYDFLIGEAELRNELCHKLDAKDHETLQRFEKELAILALELDKAEADLEIAETMLSNRKMNEVAVSCWSKELDIRHQDDYYGTAFKRHRNLKGQIRATISIADILCQGGKDSFKVYDNLEDGETVNEASFINQWLFHRLLNDEREAIRFAGTLLEMVPNAQALDVKAIVQRHWNQDGLERNSLIMPATSDKSLANSSAVENGVVGTFTGKAVSLWD